MPELPDLVYMKDYLDRSVAGSKVQEIVVQRPVVVRNALPSAPGQVLRGRTLSAVDIHGPFLHFPFPPDIDLVLNLMLAGKLQHQRPDEKRMGHLCLSIQFDNRSALNLCDDQLMAKAYFVPWGDFSAVPGYARQGLDILGTTFTLEAFQQVILSHRRKQVRVMINDHSILSSIGNAYADEILFEAGIHPKTIVARLTGEDVARLFGAINSVMLWGMEEVRRAGQPIHVKVRGHMRVRNRHGEPCPRCGTTIRREGVRGYDVFFCPQCQPPTRSLFIDWREKR